MRLPVITTPEYTINLPLSQKTIRFRPFLAKEEKILLLAIEEFTSDKTKPTILIDATMQIAQNCILTNDVDVRDLPTTDLEFLFLNIRKKSIGETVELIVQHNDGDCKFRNKVSVNLDDTKLEKKEGHSNKIQIDGNSGMILKYPTIRTSMVSDFNKDKNKTETFYSLILGSIDKVYNGDDFKEISEYKREELVAWIDTFPTELIHKFYEFFDTMPYLSTKIEYVCEKCKKHEVMEVKGTADFFT